MGQTLVIPTRFVKLRSQFVLADHVFFLLSVVATVLLR